MIEKLGEILAKFVFKQLAAELISQGHKLTGALIKSFEIKIIEQSDTLTIEFLMLDYGLSLEHGIKPDKIPYTIGGEPRGGTSKYIKGLIEFALKRFTPDKRRATQIAFAIANKHKRFGYPLTRKIGFISNVLEADKERIESIIEDFFEATIELLLKEFIRFKKPK